LAGLVRCNEISNFLERLACEVAFENGVTGVNATTELAAPATSIGINLQNLNLSTGTALSLPVKVHLENPFLGSSCYVGSNAHPIVIDFTTGTTAPPLPNKPITGNAGEFEFNETFTLLTVKNNSLVNNTFAAPGSEGCGGIFSFLIDPIINSKLGLPAASGYNTAILKGTLKAASAEAVKASE
jgi:PPE-repeat protein